jgi:hypothetical protein
MKLRLCSYGILGAGIAFGSIAVPAQSTPGASVAHIVQSLVAMHEAWSSKLTIPGASITAKEIGRDGSVVRYTLYVSGLPKGRLYTVVSWPVNQLKPTAVMEGVSLGKDGMVMCTGRMPGECSDPGDEDHGEVHFIFNSLPGEPNRLALVNGDEHAAIVIVPNPIAARDGKCTLNAERLLPHFEIAYLTGTGYSAGASVSYDVDSAGEKHSGATTADADGNIRFALLPFVAGRQKGTVRVRMEASGCSPSLQFDWGQ